jgi:hypothetical protein
VIESCSLQADGIQLTGMRLEMYNFLKNRDETKLEKYILSRKRKAAVRRAIKKMIGKR